VLAAAGAAVWHGTRHEQAPRPEPAPVVAATETQQKLADHEAKIARLQAEIARLQAEADERREILETVLALQRGESPPGQADQQTAGAEDPLAEFQRQVQNTAVILLWYGDQKLRRLGEPEAARREYERIVKDFGQTKWAAVARKRLAQLDQGAQGDTL